MDLTEQQYLGEEASKLLSHPLIREFFHQWESLSKDLWWEAKPEDMERLKDALEQKEAVKSLRRHLELYVERGKMASEFIGLAKDGTFKEM